MSSITPAALLERARTTQQTHSPFPLFPGLTRPQTILVSCADPRVIPEKIFSLTSDDGVVVFRTIAAHPQSVFDGVLALDVALGGVKDVWLLHHTDCGSTYWTEKDIKEALTKGCPELVENVEGRLFGAVKQGLEENLKEDVAWLKGQQLMHPELAEVVRGYMYDVESGELREVV